MNQLRLDSCERGFNIRKIVLIFAVILLVLYGLFNARNIIIGPSIAIYSPTSLSFETNEKTVTVSGRIKNSTHTSLNERPIYLNTEGIFQEKLLLSPGFNIIEIKAKDRFQVEKKETLSIYYKEN